MGNIWASMVELEACIGVEKANVLCQKYGGVPVYIPTMVTKHHFLAKDIGEKALQKLSIDYGGFHLEMPNLRKYKPKKERILQLIEAGVPQNEIARVCGVSVRWVRRLAQTLRT